MGQPTVECPATATGRHFWSAYYWTSGKLGQQVKRRCQTCNQVESITKTTP